MYMEMHEENLKDEIIKNAIYEMNQSGITMVQAFNVVVARCLGYELESDNFVDGSGDRGVDFWYASDSTLEIFQVKSHELTSEGKISSVPFDKEGVNDLRRVMVYLTDKEGIPERNQKLKKLKERWNYIISSKKINFSEDDEEQLITVKLSLVIVGDKLTEQASDELAALKRETATPIEYYNNIKVKFDVALYTIRDLITIKWREENRVWRDIDGKKQNWIELHPERLNWLKDSNSAVFYCPVIDLVNSYKKFGYQIFEPNVRCNIKKSKINAEIKKSIEYSQSRKEFRFLNNGVTIICRGYSKPSENKPVIKATEPGIVNGLQTVIAVSEAYDHLPNEHKDDFEKNCFVLVRLLKDNAVKKIEKVVRTTNTQNKMESRNLLSNNPEQILYENLFAELGWFYERKQGAWSAFSSDASRWRSLNNKRISDFQVNVADGRTKMKSRNVENEEIAQAWLSFIGFSDLAVHEKAKIFENEDWYQLIFLHRTLKHGAMMDYDIKKIRESSIKNSSPSPELLLAAFIARRFAKEMTLSPRENFDNATKRLGIKVENKSKEEIVAQLSKDSEYLLNSALSGMSFTFVEYLGFILYQVMGDKVHNIGRKLLSNRSFQILSTKYTFSELKDIVNNQDFEPDDILCVVWYSFRHVVNEMLGSFWAESFRTSSNKSRFVAHKDTRSRIIKGLDDLNRYTLKRELTKLWAAGITPPKGFYGYIGDLLKRYS